MINKATYLRMKELVEEYESKQPIVTETEPPYLRGEIHIDEELKYNTNFGDDRVCECGHPYYRHFDSYEEMDAIGCKYCRCHTFQEKKSI